MSEVTNVRRLNGRNVRSLKARIKALGIKSDAKHSKEEYLQSFVINHAEKFLNEHGRQIIGWDEILKVD